MKTRPSLWKPWALTALVVLLLPSVAAHAQVFHADFSKWAGTPLVKTKFGVYETPFLKKDDLNRAAALLPEAGVQDLRYEMGWGKPDTYAYDQIHGTAAAPLIDFAALDPFVRRLKQCGVTPLFAMTYDPLPLKTGTDWQRWKDMPADLAAWQEIQRRYAGHYRRVNQLDGPLYEMWNEPDIPGDHGKMFFNGSPADYANVYRAGAAGIRAGDADARVGGPAIAYDLNYARPLASLRNLDFASIHAYDNYAGQLTGLRGLFRGRPAVPLLLTEYASFTSYGPKAPVSRYPAAERFFRDAKGLLAFEDVPKVYWAQWVDDSIGLLTRNFHRKALFNALKLYQTMLPVDRNAVSPDGANSLNLLASSDSHTACVVLWNETTAERTATVHLDHLPFTQGNLQLYRIDASHASYGDDPAAERLGVNGTWKVSAGQAVWTGMVPAESVVFLQASDGSAVSLLRPQKIGTFIRDLYWFPNRGSDAYADFDPHTSIVRVGEGSQSLSAAQIGVVLDKPAANLHVQVTRQGPFAAQDANGLFGLRVDYASRQGGYSKSVLWCNSPPRLTRTVSLPWGKGGARVDHAYLAHEMNTGKRFIIPVAHNAPGNWNGRIILTPILQNMGAGSCARITLEAR
jgi:xylan 1,4-beta-xylosidase